MLNNDIHILPDDFPIASGDTMIYFYSNNKSSVNNKVVFTKNMFCLLQQGVKEVQTSTEKVRITNKEVLMLTSGSALMSESLAESNNYEAILIFFGNKTLSDFCAKQPLEIKTKTTKKSVLKIDRDEFLNNFCQSLKLLRKENNVKIDELKIQEILGYISAKYPETFQLLITQAFADTNDIKLKQIIELNTNKGLTLDELAFLCNTSVSTFKRRFAEVYKMSPQKYFTQTKMEQAKVLLSLNKRPSEIYPQLGYENLSAFSNEFKKYFGVSPKQFQNKNELLAKEFELTE